jgi:hypothetical protein
VSDTGAAPHYRIEAALMRAKAKLASTPEVRDQFEQLALLYDRLAASAAQEAERHWPGD